VNKDFQQFIDKTGFDPRRDLREVLIVTSGLAPAAGTQVSTTDGLFMAKGTFNIPQAIAAAGTDAQASVSTYAGAQLVTVGDGDHKATLAFIDGSTAVAGDITSVKAALDRSKQTNAIDPAIMARINDLSTTEDVWSISTAGFSSLPMFNGQNSNGQSGGVSAVLATIQQASCGVKFGTQVQVNAQAIAKDAGDATALSDVIKMLASMVQMGSGTKDGPPAELIALLKGLVVSTDGSAVNVSLSIPEDQLESLVKLAHGEAAAKI